MTDVEKALDAASNAVSEILDTLRQNPNNTAAQLAWGAYQDRSLARAAIVAFLRALPSDAFRSSAERHPARWPHMPIHPAELADAIKRSAAS